MKSEMAELERVADDPGTDDSRLRRLKTVEASKQISDDIERVRAEVGKSHKQVADLENQLDSARRQVRNQDEEMRSLRVQLDRAQQLAATSRVATSDREALKDNLIAKLQEDIDQRERDLKDARAEM